MITYYVFLMSCCIILLNGDDCIHNVDKTTCYESCEKCSNQSLCGLPNKCTRCKSGYFQISLDADNGTFECNVTCQFNSYPRYNYRYCQTPQNFFVVRSLITGTTIYLYGSFTKNVSQKPIIEEPFSLKSLSNYEMLIILMVLCLLIIIAFFVSFVLFSKCLRKQEHSSPTHPILIVEEEKLIKSPIKPCPQNPGNLYNTLEHITNVNEFEKNERIDGGNFSEVFDGTLRGQNVAIKRARIEGRKSIHKELQIYRRIVHPNILVPIGAHSAEDNIIFLPLRKCNLDQYLVDYETELTNRRLMEYCIQLVDAVKYLHSKNIIHCDLKVDNILIKDDDGKQIELTDFGCAKDLTYDNNSTIMCTLTHMAYELIKTQYFDSSYNGRPSPASDIWAYAVTVWQIFSKTKEIPQDFKTPKNIVENYKNGKKLPKPSLVTEYFWHHIIYPCFDLIAESRPPAEEIYNTLITVPADKVFIPES